MKRILSLVLCLALALSLVPIAGAVGFTDVPQDAWYYTDVMNAVELELVNGKTTTTYAPNDNLTYAEAAKLAACMHQRVTTGAVTLTNGTPWYQTYVDYCKDNGIITKDYAWEFNASRAGYMEIFANALPEENLQEINFIAEDSIPDVSSAHPQASAIYKLYRAGILQGNDAEHNCNPYASIMRSEVAAILTRMMDASKRISFTMGEPAEEDEKQEEDKKEEEKKEEEKVEDKNEDKTENKNEVVDPTPDTGNDNENSYGNSFEDAYGNEWELGPNDTPIVWG